MTTEIDDYDQIEVKIEVDSYSAEYAGCGSHQIELTLKAYAVEFKKLKVAIDRALTKEEEDGQEPT